MRTLGLDPGGDGRFGWAVLECLPGSLPTVTITGRAPNAEVALELSGALKNQPDAVGIDCPLFWTPTGARSVDAQVRRAIYNRGAKHASGTVQQLNSLRGACLVQGIAAALKLRACWPALPITEAHPKALLWLLGYVTPDVSAATVRLDQLHSLVSYHGPAVTEDERDAVIAAGAALAFVENRAGWIDLAASEPDPVRLISGRVGYWMPAL